VNAVGSVEIFSLLERVLCVSDPIMANAMKIAGKAKHIASVSDRIVAVAE